MKHVMLFGFFAAAMAVQAAAPVPDCTLAPGWKQEGELRSYTGDNLFEYMDGNAEGYLLYSFQNMHGVNCRSGEENFVFDVSEMSDAELAYGMFSANRDPRLPLEKIGANGQVVPRRAIFVKDKYFVEFTFNTPGDHSEILRTFAKAFAERIPGSTEMPAALGWFPAEKMTQGTARLVPESVLGLRALKRGYVAQYEYGKAFVVREATPDSASEVMKKLQARIAETQPAQMGDEAFQAKDRYLGRLFVFRKGQYVAGFANLAEGQDAAALAKLLAAKMP